MNKYYTTIETQQNGRQFVGIVYDSSSNQQVYKTNLHPSHFQAVNEVNDFLKTKLTANQVPTPGTSIEINNTIKPITIQGIIPSSGKRCCGR